MLTNFSSEICHWWEKLVFKASCQKAFRKSGEIIERVYQRQKGRRGSRLQAAQDHWVKHRIYTQEIWILVQK